MSSSRQTELDTSTMVPAAKRAQDKADYERRKIEEEEFKKQVEEERQKQLDQYGGVEDNMTAIPIQRILEMKLKSKQQEMQNTMSQSMASQPVSNMLTIMGTSITNQLQLGATYQLARSESHVQTPTVVNTPVSPE